MRLAFCCAADLAIIVPFSWKNLVDPLTLGMGLERYGAKRRQVTPLQSEMNNKTIEPIVKKYDELRYQLLPYNYTLTWEARITGMPLMRSLWLHYPKDETARKTGRPIFMGT